MNFYIADTHFGHRSVLAFDGRPFADVEEMDRTMIQWWNSRVQRDDHVYIVGDFAYRSELPEEWYLERLKGRKHLIIGNHDKRLLKNEKAMSHFEEVDKMLHVPDSGNQICICHFPLAEWNGFYKGSHHIHGHIHNRTDDAYAFMKTRERAYNAGCMLHNYAPATFAELMQAKKMMQAEKGLQAKKGMQAHWGDVKGRSSPDQTRAD